jgi:ABC-2 type transport system permease protein
MLQELSMLEESGNQRIQARTEQLQRERDQNINKIDTQLNVLIRKVQNQYKSWAVLLPPIPPLLVGLAVFFVRRAREREGVSRSRLR